MSVRELLTWQHNWVFACSFPFHEMLLVAFFIAWCQLMVVVTCLQVAITGCHLLCKPGNYFSDFLLLLLAQRVSR